MMSLKSTRGLRDPRVVRRLRGVRRATGAVVASIVELQTLEIRRLLTTASINSSHILNIVGTSGADAITLNRRSDGRVTVTGVSGSFAPGSGSGQFNRINITANGGNDRVTINNNVPYNSSTISGGTGNDTLAGGRGNDSILGGDGDDMLDGGILGADSLIGNGGHDVSNYSARTDPLRISLDGASNDGGNNGAEHDNVQTEEVITGAGNDTVTGSSGADFEGGGAGADSLRGGGGDDLLVGSVGSDSMFGENGDDALQAQNQDADIVNGGTNTDGSPDFDIAQIDLGLDTSSLSASSLSALRALQARQEQAVGGAANGDLDPTYGTAGKAIGPDFNWRDFAAAAVDSQGRTVIVGTAFGDGTGEDMAVMRYNADGQLDTTFGNNGQMLVDFTQLPGPESSDNDEARAVAIDGNDNIYVAGSTVPFSLGRNDTDTAVAKLTSSGQLDPTFSGDGKFTFDLAQALVPGVTQFRDDEADAVAIQSDGKVALGITVQDPTTGNAMFAAMRLTTLGTLDPTFNDVGWSVLARSGDGVDDHVSAIALQALDTDAGAQRIVLGGTSFGQLELARFTPDGSTDTTFGTDGVELDEPGNGFADQLNALAVAADNSLVVAGETFLGDARIVPNALGFENGILATYGADGAPIDAINVDGVRFTAVTVDPSNRIVVAGDDGNDTVLGRYHFNLTPDDNFNGGELVTTDFSDDPTNLDQNDKALGVAVLSDGKIILGGDTDTSNDGTPISVAARFLADRGNIEIEVTGIEGFWNDRQEHANPPLDPIAPYIDNLSGPSKFYFLSQPRSDGTAELDLQPNLNDVTFSIVTAGDGKKVLAVNVDGLVLYYDPETTTLLKFIGTDGNDTVHAEGFVNVPLFVDGKGGNDFIEGGGLNDSIFGGSGNDTLNGEAGNDIVLGGSGNDTMRGGSGRDLVIGGTGPDKISGSENDDIVIGGTTAYDDDLSSLEKIMAEWTGPNLFVTRVANLMNGGGANGDVVFKSGGPDATVFDDNAVDSLTGFTGKDWFFAHTSGTNKDILTDFTPGFDVLSNV